MDWIREFSCFQPILIVPSRAILKFKFRASTFGIVWLVRDNGTQIQCKTFGAMVGNELYILYRARDSRHYWKNSFETFGLTFEVCSDGLPLKRREDRAHAFELAE